MARYQSKAAPISCWNVKADPFACRIAQSLEEVGELEAGQFLQGDVGLPHMLLEPTEYNARRSLEEISNCCDGGCQQRQSKAGDQRANSYTSVRREHHT